MGDSNAKRDKFDQLDNVNKTLEHLLPDDAFRLVLESQEWCAMHNRGVQGIPMDQYETTR